MKTTRLAYLLAISLIIATGTSIFFGIRSNNLQRELADSTKNQQELSDKISAEKKLFGIDSLLVDGEYQQALNAYEEQIEKQEIADGPAIEMRVALIKELLRLRYENQMTELQEEKHQEIDSIKAEGELAQVDIMLTDSLSFALEKATVQLQCLKKQLKEKSFGEYLTFTNSKGSTMHYVGQVKNGKANGYGVALLSTGSRYEGNWKNNMRHGEGTYTWSDGQYYKGEYLNDKRNGQGTYYWPNGQKYAGQWEDDERDGRGIFYDKDGQIVADGTWHDDKLEDKAQQRRAKTGSN